MITKRKLEIYKYYNKDGDAFARLGTTNEHNILDYQDWVQIDNLIQDLFLIKRGLTAPAYNISVNQLIDKACDTQETILILKELVNAADSEYENEV